MTFHGNAISAVQQGILRQLGAFVAAGNMYLGGGTAVALQVGHRRSIDLDWFSPHAIPDPMLLAQELRDAGIPFDTGTVDRGTLHGTVSGVRVSFLESRYPLLEPPITWQDCGCPIASLDDLAAMKLLAVTQRGTKRDFVDVYALGQRRYDLTEMLQLYVRKFSVHDTARVLYSLTYFDDADPEPMPEMLWQTSWQTIQATIRRWVREIVSKQDSSNTTA